MPATRNRQDIKVEVSVVSSEPLFRRCWNCSIRPMHSHVLNSSWHWHVHLISTLIHRFLGEFPRQARGEAPLRWSESPHRQCGNKQSAS